MPGCTNQLKSFAKSLYNLVFIDNMEMNMSDETDFM